MKSIMSKHIGHAFVLTAVLLAGCSEAALNEPLQKATSAPTQAAVPAQSEPVQIDPAYETNISALKSRPEILAAFKTSHDDPNFRLEDSFLT